MPENLKRIVRNRSNRNGLPRIVVLHTTEGHERKGVSDLTGLASFFDNPASQASSHLGIDAEGNCIRMVEDRDKAWTCAEFNSISLNIEQVGFASTRRSDWVKYHSRGLYRVAEALAEWSHKYAIPLKHSAQHGVCEHSDLGVAGGGHHDCGAGYPLALVILWARLIYYRRYRHGKLNSARVRGYKMRVNRALKRYGAPIRSTGRHA